MKDIVIVQSKTINNESVPVVFHTVEKVFGGVKDVREISRSYIFQDFKARMPIKLAKILIKQTPKEFSIVKPAGKKPSKELKQEVAKQVKKQEGFTCEYCKKVCKSKAGLKSHIRSNHPEAAASTAGKAAKAKGSVEKK